MHSNKNNFSNYKLDPYFKKIQNNVIDIKDKLSKSNLDIYYKTKSTINNNEAFPIDFQIFLEEIGPLSIGNGYLFIDIETPKKLVELNLESFDSIFGSCLDRVYMENDDFYGSRAGDVWIFGSDVDAYIYFFDVSEKQTKLVTNSPLTNSYKNFLDLFVSILNKNLEYTGHPLRF